MPCNVIPMRTAGPAAAGGMEQAALQAHQEAANALAMALHYLRASASNIPGATRKAVQAVAALQTLHALDSAEGQAL